LLASAFFSSGEKKELPVAPHEPGDVKNATVNMGEDYRWQIYYDLETGQAVGQNLKTAWDLGFETGADGFHVILNSSKMMFAYNTGKEDMSGVTISDTAGKKSWDTPDGHPDSTAIGDWRLTKSVYIIDRGISSGAKQGWWKIQITDVNAEEYAVLFSKMDGSEETALTITKDSLYNHSFLSFSEKKQVMIEPPKTDWDFTLTQYTHVFHEPVMPYLVTGCLLNRFSTSAVLDTTTDFTAITADRISQLVFSTAANSIGYDWKYFNGDTYITLPEMNFIIHNRHGKYYKLHFVDFMEAGVKGHPRWEYQSL
jgi:hypothetical protein